MLVRRGPRPLDAGVVVGALFPAVDLMRTLTLAYAILEYAQRLGEVARPAVGWVILAVLGAWTVGTVVTRRRSPAWMVAESILGCAAILATRLVDTPEVIAAGASTVPGLWPSATVVAWAGLAGAKGAIPAATVVVLADIVEVGGATSGTVRNIVLLFLLGACMGYCVDLLRDGHKALSDALAMEARSAERDRLARTVHDGVLQTLTFIHRRGVDLGGDARELGLMAADQERVLRALISGADELDVDLAGTRYADLRTVLGRHDTARVHLIAPAEAVRMPRERAEELSLAVGAALDNVRAHAGEKAQAWVLVEEDGPDVVVTVRDDGTGVSEARLIEAMNAGRLGVSRSILGRLHDLGGVATYASGSGTGTSVEMRMPIEQVAE